jgi:hypothetical protein
LRRMILQFLHIFLMDALTFIIYLFYLARNTIRARVKS